MDDTIKQHEQVVVVVEEESSSDKKERIVNEFIQLFASEMYGSEILTKIILEQDLIKFSEWHQHETFSPKEWKEFISPIATSNVYSTIIYHLIEFCGMKAKIKDSTNLTKMIYRLIENSSSLLPLFSTILSYDKKKMIELCGNVLHLYDREYGLIPFDDADDEMKTVNKKKNIKDKKKVNKKKDLNMTEQEKVDDLVLHLENPEFFNLMKEFVEKETSLENLTFYEELKQFERTDKNPKISHLRDKYFTDNVLYELNVGGQTKQLFHNLVATAANPNGEVRLQDLKSILDGEIMGNLSDAYLRLKQQPGFKQLNMAHNIYIEEKDWRCDWKI